MPGDGVITDMIYSQTDRSKVGEIIGGWLSQRSAVGAKMLLTATRQQRREWLDLRRSMRRKWLDC